ncbi:MULTISPECIES: RodZ domain-containing protein [Oxalobacteraceae]|uniref:RodZ domain-containing protein n=1 Tax=Herminiimonas sp. Marseille-P9896 TaxID=2742211 RepID=UPI001588B701|nr:MULTISPECIES: RodZ domain-containing protein [Oxalobacteraceae]
MSNDVPVNETMNDAVPEPAQEAVQPEPVISAGTQLVALREERGWTVEQVANQLNLASRQIQALEEDNYAALPGMVIVRGFIRSYAKVLRVDPAPILAAIKEDKAEPAILPPERSPLSASFSETKLLSSNSRGLNSKVVLGGGILVVLGLLAYAGQHMGWVSHSTLGSPAKVEEKLAPIELSDTPAGAVVEVPPPIEITETSVAESKPAEVKPVEAAKPAAEPVAVAAKPAAPAATAPVSAAPAAVAATTPAAPAATPVVKPAPVAAVAKPVVPVDSKNALAINVREDSWVEIKGADNNVLLSRLLKAGSSEAVAVTGPVSVVIGNAAGVDVTLRGAPVDVVTGNSSNVARLNLK